MRKISFGKVLDATVAPCRVMELGRDLIDEATRAEWTRRVLVELTDTALIPTRKPRSCNAACASRRRLEEDLQPTLIP